MPIFTKFVKTPGGQVRFEATTRPPGMIEGFRNPVPPPPPGGGGKILSKLIKYGGKFLSIPLYVIFDFFGNLAPLESGDIPDWVKDPGEKQNFTIGRTRQFSGTPGVHYDIKYRYREGANQPWKEAIIVLPYYTVAPFALIDWTFRGGNVDEIYTGSIKLEAWSYGTGYQGSWSLGVNCGDGSGGLYRNSFEARGTNYGSPPATYEVIELIPGDSTASVPLTEVDVTDSTESSNDLSRASSDVTGAEEWSFSQFVKLSGIGQSNQKPQINSIPQPKITDKPGIVPTPTPQPIPEPEPKPEVKPEFDSDTKEIIKQKPEFDSDTKKTVEQQEGRYPNLEPGKEYIKRITTRDSEGRTIKITESPAEVLNPKPQPIPDPKPAKITTKKPVAEKPKVTFLKPPSKINLEKTPTPTPTPQPEPVKQPTQTKVDKCADACIPTVNFNLPDNSELAECLARIKQQLDEIEDAVNVKLEGEIKLGSCETPDNSNTSNDESTKSKYVADAAKTIKYSDKGLTAINSGLLAIADKLTSLHEALCEPCDAIATIPEGWQLKKEQLTPQLAIIFRPEDSQVRSGNYPLYIPHYNGNPKPKITGYKKGDYWARWILSDNSQIHVNASSKAESLRVIRMLEK